MSGVFGPSASISAASQAEQETGTITTAYVSPGRQKFHQSAAKAWVTFNGTGTIAISASYNVTSLTDNGSGSYDVNFTVAFSSGAYSAIGSCNEPAGVTTVLHFPFAAGGFATTAVGIVCKNNLSANTDVNMANVACYGDQ